MKVRQEDIARHEQTRELTMYELRGVAFFTNNNAILTVLARGMSLDARSVAARTFASPSSSSLILGAAFVHASLILNLAMHLAKCIVIFLYLDLKFSIRSEIPKTSLSLYLLLNEFL